MLRSSRLAAAVWNASRQASLARAVLPQSCQAQRYLPRGVVDIARTFHTSLRPSNAETQATDVEEDGSEAPNPSAFDELAEEPAATPELYDDATIVLLSKPQRVNGK